MAGDFDFEVAAGSTQPHNESFKRQMALQMVDAMSPFAGAGIVNMQKLAAYVLQFGFGVKNPDEFLQAPPPPVPAEGAMGMPPESPQTAPQGAGEPPAGPESSLPPEVIAMLQQGQGAPPA